jgi:Na+/H+-dicarboxylate symporter
MRTISYFLATSLLNAVLGTVLVAVIQPGAHTADDDLNVAPNTKKALPLLDSFLDLGRYCTLVMVMNLSQHK